MKTTIPTLEKINPAFGSSIHISHFNESSLTKNKNPNWHVHPEMELVYVNGGNGKRHIGNQLSYYNGGDLILIGANLPHYGFTDRLTGNKAETIIQMKEDFLPIPTHRLLPWHGRYWIWYCLSMYCCIL